MYTGVDKRRGGHTIKYIYNSTIVTRLLINPSALVRSLGFILALLAKRVSN